MAKWLKEYHIHTHRPQNLKYKPRMYLKIQKHKLTYKVWQNQQIKNQKWNTLKFHTHTCHFQSANIPDVHTNLKHHFLTFLVQDLFFFATNITARFKRNKNNLTSDGEEGRAWSRMIHIRQVYRCQITYKFTIHMPVQFTTYRCFPWFLRLRRRPAWDTFRVNRSVCCGFTLSSRAAVDLAYIPNTFVVHIKLSMIMVSQK